jgi:hypothetical protein
MSEVLTDRRAARDLARRRNRRPLAKRFSCAQPWTIGRIRRAWTLSCKACSNWAGRPRRARRHPLARGQCRPHTGKYAAELVALSPDGSRATNLRWSLHVSLFATTLAPVERGWQKIRRARRLRSAPNAERKRPPDDVTSPPSSREYDVPHSHKCFGISDSYLASQMIVASSGKTLHRRLLTAADGGVAPLWRRRP